MKIRIRHNSIRLRLTQSETKNLEAGQVLDERLLFPGGSSLGFQLRASTTFGVEFDKEVVRIALPADEVRTWLSSDQLGLTHTFSAASPDSLRLLVEKDLRCKTDRPGEDESDAFPNPTADKC